MKNEGELSCEEISAGLAHELALEDLEQAGIPVNSPAGEEFMSRVALFGVMGVQPPRPELNRRWEKVVGPDAVFIHE